MQDQEVQDSEAAGSVEGGGLAHEVSTTADTDTTTAMEQTTVATCTTGMHESDTHELKAVERKMTPEEKAHREEILRLTATAAITTAGTTAVTHMEEHEAAEDQKPVAKETQENQGVADDENSHSNVEDSAYTALAGMAARLDNPHQSGQLSFFPDNNKKDPKTKAPNVHTTVDTAYSALSAMAHRWDNPQESGQLSFFPDTSHDPSKQQHDPNRLALLQPHNEHQPTAGHNTIGGETPLFARDASENERVQGIQVIIQSQPGAFAQGPTFSSSAVENDGALRESTDPLPPSDVVPPNNNDDDRGNEHLAVANAVEEDPEEARPSADPVDLLQIQEREQKQQRQRQLLVRFSVVVLVVAVIMIVLGSWVVLKHSLSESITRL